MSLQNTFYRKENFSVAPTREHPLCSIIIPAYRAENTLALTLESVLNQTMPSWEAIIVIDGVFPNDSTLQIARNYVQRDPRFRVFVDPQNHGVAYARNQGVNQARGPWIAFLDSDDQFHPQKLQQQLTLAERTNCHFVCSSYNVTDNTGKILRHIKAPQRISRARLIFRNVIGCSTVLLRRELALQYPMHDEVIHEDYLCWLECLQGCDGRACSHPLVNVQSRSNSRNSNKWRSIQGVWEIYRHHLHFNFFKSVFFMTTYGFMGVYTLFTKGSDVQ